MKTAAMVRCAAAVALCAGAASAQVELYAVSFPGNLYRLNTTTGAGTLVGATGTDRLNAAAANSVGVIYASRSRNPTVGTDTNRLIRIDRTTGIGTLVIDYGAAANDIRGLAFGPGDVLFGVRDAPAGDELITIDTATGAVTLVGSTGFTDVQGLTSIPGGGLYGSAVFGNLYRIDPTTGAGSLIGNGLGDGQSLEWAFGNMAWVCRVNLSLVDLATAATTLVGPTGQTDIRGLAAVRGTACYANCDGSTAAPVLTVNDFICFQSRFAAGDSYANCDGSTSVPVLTVNDFICFQGRFAAGCP